MTVTDQVIAQAQQLAGDEDDGELLNLLCRTAVSTLTAQLREDFTPESCREDFVTAASLYALSQWRRGRQTGPLREFKAGDLTLKSADGGGISPEILREQAMQLLRPYCKGAFSFRGV